MLSNPSTDRRGRPFPTRHWLSCRHLVRAVSRLEAAGGVRDLENDPEMSVALAEAQAQHADAHDGHWITGTADPATVKCLHAHLAVALAGGGSPIGDWISGRIDDQWPTDCCLENLREAAADG